MSTDLKALRDMATDNARSIGALTKSINGLVDRLSKTPAAGHPSESDAFGLPNVRRGEDPMSSRGFSFMKMLGLVSGACGKEDAKVELDMHNRMHNCLVKELGGAGYEYKGLGVTGANRFMAPLASSFMEEKAVPREFRREMRQVVCAGTDGADYDEMNWIRRKQFAGRYGTKAMSWLNELTGGALVAPPEQGELIELLRNKEALVSAGARTVPLPPQGRIKYPRHTNASTAYWVGESKRITESEVGTGEVSLQAKKLAVLVKSPNELIRFASPAAEALIRDDMTKSLALGLDLAGLEGNGGDHRPLGIINQQGINIVTSSDARANGDRLVGQDFYRMIAVVEESNAECEGFIMRPKTLYKSFQLRSDAVSQGDGSGPFLFNLIREGGDDVKPTIAGLGVTKSTQVSQVRSKGTSSALTYVLAGMFSDVLIGMFGAIEFAATTMGDTTFELDQTWVRAILSADIALRHSAAFAIIDSLDTTL